MFDPVKIMTTNIFLLTLDFPSLEKPLWLPLPRSFIPSTRNIL